MTAGTVHRAEIHSAGRGRIEVVLDDAYRYETARRKSWSMKRYVDDALAHFDLIPAWDMSYGWDLS